MDRVAEAGLRRNDPVAHSQQIKDGYISGVVEHRPAVISINSFAAAYAVTEFLARLHPFRDKPNEAMLRLSSVYPALNCFLKESLISIRASFCKRKWVREIETPCLTYLNLVLGGQPHEPFW